MSDLNWRPDMLGAGYDQHVFQLGADPDGEGAIEAVLVRRVPRPGEVTRGAVLYVHGFTDYFFQTELADFFAARGLRFYALDLRKCGRARRPGQTAHYVSDLARYDEELDQALSVITEENPGLPVIVAAHSTGGLIVPLWLHRRRTVDVSITRPVIGAVLNSPWLDLQVSWMVRGPLTQLVRLRAKTRPLAPIKVRPGVYGQTLHVSGTGEWEYDTDLKPLHGFPVTVGWMAAVRQGHAHVHHGIETGVPVLVLRSDKSLKAAEYSPACDRCDLILNTKQIGRWARSLGSQVTDVVVADARHDVFLSVLEARQCAYAALGTWLDRVLLR
jgi:alpha-beta hydrolase superfamily lysophospholipase